MRTVTLEEHFAFPRFFDGPGRKLKEQAANFPERAGKLLDQLSDLGDKRIAEMDAARIDMQVVSITSPGMEQLQASEAVALAPGGERLPRGWRAASSGSVRRLCIIANRRSKGGSCRIGAGDP